MPRIRTNKTRKAPKGWDLIEPTLMELTDKIREGIEIYHELTSFL